MLKTSARAVLIGLLILPFLYLLTASVASEWRFPALLPLGWTLGHWTELGSSGGNWGASALTSFALAFLVGICATGAGFLTAQQLSKHPKRQLWLIMAYLPYAFSPVIYAHCIKFYFNVSGMAGSFAGVLFAHFLLCYPFATLLFFRYFDASLRALESLSFTLGASSRATFWRVLLPVSRTALLICFFQTFLISWFEYGLVSVIGQGQVRTLTIGVYQYIGEANPYLAALASCLVCLPPLLLLWINQRYVFRQSSV